jgi:hypothetical protein
MVNFLKQFIGLVQKHQLLPLYLLEGSIVSFSHGGAMDAEIGPSGPLTPTLSPEAAEREQRSVFARGELIHRGHSSILGVDHRLGRL